MRVNALTLILLLALPGLALAGKQPVTDQQNEEELPDAELLEFIAEFEPLDGQWIDPVQLNMIFAENRNGNDKK